MTESYKRTLYAVKSACLNGLIPADMTGQFVTNNMPQLYPRDAMKSARVFLNLGYKEEARSIIQYWCGKVPMKSKGEFYARYDARCAAVDAGSGARFDEPEWDANGYLTQLLYWYYNKYGEWLAPKEFVYELSDFIVSKIDESGLLYEGGIVEWTAYLPTTNMICSAGLTTAAKIAAENGESAKAQSYHAAAQKIADNLFQTYNLEKNTYSAVRFHGLKDDNKSLTEQSGAKLYLWDGTMQFGALWGYPIHPMLQSTIQFYEENIIKPEGGMQYFEALDNGGLSSYGGDLFFFSTAALSQYYSLYVSKEKALHHIKWMINNANIYGLMPERIYLNYSDCSDASPLTWCNAEFAAAIYTYLQ
ncbi:MAG: hypothetical protein HYV28_07220 [Ignavibacteriales bacterium]|nr:hypothetical protein [Ignavibacteriales bacterium]